MTRSIILSLLLAAAALGQTTYEVYVDTGATGTGSGADWTNAYTVFNNAVVAMRDTAVTGDTVNFHLRRTGAGGIDTTAVLFLGGGGVEQWATGVTVTVTGELPEDGIWDPDTTYLLQITSSSNSSSLRADGMAITVSNLQVGHIGSGTGIVNGISMSNADGCVIDSCIVKGTQSGTGTGRGIYASNSDNAIIRNCVIYDWISGEDNSYNGVVAYGEAGDDVFVYNCTVAGNYRGLNEGGSGTLTATNCAIFNNTDDLYGSDFTATYCAIDDADSFTGKVSLNENASGEWAAAFTDYANGDFSVKDTDSLLYNAGADLSGTVDDDILGIARATHDIGAFEYEPPSSPANILLLVQ